MKRPGIAPFAIAAISCLCSAQPAAAKDAPLWSECGQVQGLEKLTRDKSLKILVVGEPHGANETINTFKNIVPGSGLYFRDPNPNHQGYPYPLY